MVASGVAKIPGTLLPATEGYPNTKAAVRSSTMLRLLGGESTMLRSGLHLLEYLVVYIAHPAIVERTSHEPDNASAVHIENGYGISKVVLSKEGKIRTQ